MRAALLYYVHEGLLDAASIFLFRTTQLLLRTGVVMVDVSSVSSACPASFPLS